MYQIYEGHAKQCPGLRNTYSLSLMRGSAQGALYTSFIKTLFAGFHQTPYSSPSSSNFFLMGEEEDQEARLPASRSGCCQNLGG